MIRIVMFCVDFEIEVVTTDVSRGIETGDVEEGKLS